MLTPDDLRIPETPDSQEPEEQSDPREQVSLFAFGAGLVVAAIWLLLTNRVGDDPGRVATLGWGGLGVMLWSVLASSRKQHIDKDPKDPENNEPE